MLKLCKMLVVPLLFGVALFSVLTIAPYLLPLETDRGCSPVNACIANLKQLDGAKATWAFEHGKQRNDLVTWGDIIGETNYIRSMPVCPSRGKYTLAPVGTSPLCSLPGHVLP